jgi:hypothetical protein
VPLLGGGKQDRVLIEGLGVEEQTIHVEDDGGWSARELHGLGLGRISPHLNRRLVLAFTEIDNMAEQPIRGPLNEAHLDHHLPVQGGGVLPNSEDQPVAPALTYEPGETLPREIETDREAVQGARG